MGTIRNKTPKKNPVGRPVGTTGAYKPEHLVRQNLSVRIPAWLKERLKKKHKSEVGTYLEELILTDNPSWKPPKK